MNSELNYLPEKVLSLGIGHPFTCNLDNVSYFRFCFCFIFSYFLVLLFRSFFVASIFACSSWPQYISYGTS